MKPPAEDLDSRRPVWDVMQMFWMDTDPIASLAQIARVCAMSDYTLQELESIFWNEVFPAVGFNMWCLPAPAWQGFELDCLTNRVLKVNRYGKRLPAQRLHSHGTSWKKLAAAIEQCREETQQAAG